MLEIWNKKYVEFKVTSNKPIQLTTNENLTQSDYHSYSKFREEIQSKIDGRLELLVFECWDNQTVDFDRYNDYLKILKQNNN